MKKIKWHIIIWLAYTVYVLILDIISYKSDFNIVREFVMIGIETWVFYSFFFCLKNFNSKNFILFIKSVGFLFLSIGSTFYFNYLRVLVAKYYGVMILENSTKFIINSVIIYTQFSIYSLGYFFAQRSIQRQKQLRQSEKKQAEAEKAKLEAENKSLRLQEEKATLQNEKIKIEYNFLKAQINPHFLYNTLNFFYVKVLMHSAEAAEGIVKLTDIMRYALRSGDDDGKVFLTEEIEHIQNYIDLQQMRFNNTINIQFIITGNLEGYRILPHILVTLLENAFKHGDTINPDQPIVIHLQVNDQYLHYSIHNKIRIGPKDGPSTGVGLPNIADRLRMEYGDKQNLQYNSDGNFFDVYLSIQLAGINGHHRENTTVAPINFKTKTL